MRTRNILAVLLLLIFIAVPSSYAAQSNEDLLFEQANAKYNEGNYDSALVMYEDIVNQDLVSMPLFFNLGNTYYKLKNFPMAILNYEKALKLDPRNEDVRTNLDIANLAIVDRIEPVPQVFIITWWSNFKNMFSADSWAVMSLLLFAIILFSVFIFLTARKTLLRKAGFYVGIITLVLFVLSMLFSLQKHHEQNNLDKAILMTPTITVKSSPSTSGVDLFVLHEGSKVLVLDKAEDWTKVKIANGSVGWLPSDSMIEY